MADQCYRGLDGHPTELKRMRDIAARLGPAGGEAQDVYKEEIGYNAEEMAEAAKNPVGTFAGSEAGSTQPNPPDGGTELIEAGVTSNNSPNAMGKQRS